jgi:predicted transposase/invertase (TIGR01784 family)
MKEKDDERLNPLNDYLFLKYMGEPGDEEQLLAFLNAVLQKNEKNRIASVKIEECKTFTAEIIGDKSSILDLRAVTADGVKVNIEVQIRNVWNMDKRSLFYWSREYIRGIEAGQDYVNLPEVIAINIISFDFIQVKEFHTCFHLWEDTHRDIMLTDALEIHFISMPKFRQEERNIDIIGNPLHRWMTFFDKGTDEETIKKIIEMDTGIAKAQEKISFVSQDKEALRAYQMREMALSDYTSGINHAHNEGKQQGIVIGEQRGIVIGKQQGIVIGEQQGIVIGEQRGIVIGKQLGEQRALAKYVLKLAQKGTLVEEIAELTDLPVKDINDVLENR